MRQQHYLPAIGSHATGWFGARSTATEDSRACERRSWKQADILSIYIPLCGLVGDRFGYKQYARAARLASYFNFQKFLLCFDSMEIMHAV